MEAIKHFLISLVVAPFVVYNLTVNVGDLFFPMIIFGIACGTLIDLDHYFWIYYNHGFGTFRKTVVDSFVNFRTIMTDNAEIVHDTKEGLTSEQRYISHLTILAIAPFVVYLLTEIATGYLNLGTYLFQISIIMLGTHIISDIFEDYKNDGFKHL